MTPLVEWLTWGDQLLTLERQAHGSRLSFDGSGWLELQIARRDGQTAANRDAMALAALADHVKIEHPLCRQGSKSPLISLISAVHPRIDP